MNANPRQAMANGSAGPADGWDSELFLIDGPDRDALCERVRSLSSHVDAHPATRGAHLAATLARTLGTGGVRLAVVATSLADLRKKLGRAAERMADATCRQIRDAAGVYFFAEPLYVPGNLAVIFPGEGAQYAGMMADLCGPFPEVEATFAMCDRVALEAGRPEQSLRKIIHPPANATEAEKALAEAELRKLGPSIFGVLVGDLVIDQVLKNLQVPVAAFAGHSAGELAALVAAGSIPAEANFGRQLTKIQDIMQQQEDTAGGADVALIAVGAGSKAVREIAADIAGDAVIVAMDNCPHQCVAVGPTHLVAPVEASLRERGFFCERLPFNRPYHTPLFEPWMGPFRSLFAGIPFETPQIPVYSGSTGERFPADPAEVRTLAVDHWVSPVEFTKLIETMHANGIRLFVEAGPRGNLSAFVEDILRGRPFAALPANTSRRSGPTQINHLVAQLAAHHVPLNLEHLYARREIEPISGLFGPENRLTGVFEETHPPVEFMPDEPTPDWEPASDSASLMNAYLATMEQFLDVQHDVMTAFLTGAPGGKPSLESWEQTLPEHPPETTAPDFVLLGRLEHFVRGRELVARRTLDEAEDRYADDHTLGGRGVSRVNPGQNGLPVMPMTFSLEMMAEAAVVLAPGKVVVAIRQVRLSRWLPFDPEPTTLEVRASVLSSDEATGIVEVRADIRDMGNSFVRDGANKVASEAVIVLADAYPAEAGAMPFTLTAETPCTVSVEVLRRNMFHGPIFQMIRSLDRTGNEGIEGSLEVQPRDTWLRSDPAPNVVLDPALVDAAMHLFGAWHLEQPDWTGRILLPFEVARIDFFGPIPAIGDRCVIRGHNEQESPRHFRHGLEIFYPDGRTWLRMTGAGYWRFYLPFGDVNFFGPKDEYFLSRDLPAACAARGSDTPLQRCHFLEAPADLKQPVLRAAGARVTMTPLELAKFQAWPGTDAELNDWFFGAMLAKDAVRAVWAMKHGEAVFPADIETDSAGDGRFVTRPRGQAGPEPMPPVSVAIHEGKIAAFSAFAERVGIALVKMPKGKAAGASARVSAAVQAVADALRIGAEGLNATLASDGSRAVVQISPELLVKFPGLPARALAQTAIEKDMIVATTTCREAP